MLLILNSTLILLNFVPKMSFVCKFGPKTSIQKQFVQNENIYKEYSEMLILNSTIVFLSSIL